MMFDFETALRMLSTTTTSMPGEVDSENDSEADTEKVPKERSKFRKKQNRTGICIGPCVIKGVGASLVKWK